MENNCVFCSELAGSRKTNFAVRYPELGDRVIATTPSLVAFPCLGQLSPGHFLIVPRFHNFTFRHVQHAVPEVHDEFVYLLNRVHEVLALDLRGSLIFEHGACDPADGGCGIYHAHVHIVPKASLISHEDAIGFQPAHRATSLRQVWQGRANSSYVLAGSVDTGFSWSDLASPLPSQSLRRNVARSLKVDEWDWRKATRETAMFEALETVRLQKSRAVEALE